MEGLYSKPMSNENERLLFIVGEELPAMKHLIKREADRQAMSSTQLMVKTLCEYYKLSPPARRHRPAREVQESESLALSVPVKLWQKIHADSGRRLTSKKEIVLAIFRDAFEQDGGKPRRKRAA